MNKLFLIDAYALIYRSYYALIRAPRINSKGLNTSAIMGFCNTLNEVITKEQPTHIAVAFDHGKTFRHEAYPPYKAQREETPEDIRLSIPIIKNILTALNIAILQVDGYEADDIIGCIATKAGDENITSYMLTPDKDYAQLVGKNIFMYKPRHGGGYDILDTDEVCKKYAVSSPQQVIDLLALMGDSADNFPGCPGVGPKTAEKLIAEWGTCENMILHAGDIKGSVGKKIQDHIEDIKISKFLARIETNIPALLEDFPTLLHRMEYQEPNAEELLKIFEELEFKTLAKKFLGNKVDATDKNIFGVNNTSKVKNDSKTSNANKNKKASKNVTGELDLFGLFDDQQTEVEEKREDFSLKNKEHEYQLIENKDEAQKLCDKLLTTEFCCFDTETTSTSPIDAELVGMSFSWEVGKAYYVNLVQGSRLEVQGSKFKVQGETSITDIEMLEIFKPFFENEKIIKIGQNMKYDIEVLSKYDIEVKGVKYDTMIAHYLIQPELRHNMDYMAETMLDGYKTIHYDDIVPRDKTMADLSPTLVKDYACEDADITLQLWNKLEPQLHNQEGLWELFTNIEMPLMEVLADMELTGVSIDTETLKEVSKLFTERMNEHERHIYELAGHSFNISSPRQVGEVLFDQMKIIDKPKKTKTGQYVTSEEVLQSLRTDNEIVAEILDYRGLKKLIGTYIDALPKLVNKHTGRIHTSYNQCVTATGRLSSSDPNLQNIPVRGEDGKEIRKCFIASPPTPEGGVFKNVSSSNNQSEKSIYRTPLLRQAQHTTSGAGWLFFSADYSQIELRVMAHLSQDEHMMEAFREGFDIHAATAANVYNKDRDEVTRDERTKAKRANFGIIYGISAWGLSQSLEIDRKEAKALMDGFFETFPKVKDYMETSKEKARQTGYASTLLHRRRYLPGLTDHNATVRGFAERNAINAPIQGTAADIIKIAMVRIFKRFKDSGLHSKMILQVHDELNFSVIPEEKEIVEKIVIEEMQNAYPLSVPLIADSGWGDNWLEAH